MCGSCCVCHKDACLYIGINVEEIRAEEERVMLQDAKRLHNDPTIIPVMSSSGATPLHVAAAKNYISVLT